MAPRQNRACSSLIHDLAVVYVTSFCFDECDALFNGLGFNEGRILFSHFMILGESLDDGLLSEEGVVNLFSQGNGLVVEEILEENVVEKLAGKYKGKMLLGSAHVIRIFIRLEMREPMSRLVPLNNVVNAEDHTDMVDGHQQGNKDVVFGNIDQENKDVVFGKNAQDVDE
ncbi:hypothetical protein Tco_1319138 [Tanacetum coccineum]